MDFLGPVQDAPTSHVSLQLPVAAAARVGLRVQSARTAPRRLCSPGIPGQPSGARVEHASRTPGRSRAARVRFSRGLGAACDPAGHRTV